MGYNNSFYGDYRLGQEALNLLYHDEFIKQIKAVEKIAISSMITAKRLRASAYRTELEIKLEQTADDMKTYASKTYPSHIQEGLTGKTAESASNFLTNLKKPNLINPIFR